jgi:predicted PurR-regulated permease PerM
MPATKAFLLLLGAVTLAFAWILWPFLGAILWAAALVIVFYPLHQRISLHMPDRPSLAALLTSLVIVLVVILPLALITGTVVQEAIDFYHRVQAGAVNLSPPPWANSILGHWGVTSLATLWKTIFAGLERNVPFVAFHALAFWHDSLAFSTNLLAMLYLIFFLLRDGPLLVERMSDAIPLDRELRGKLATRFVAVVRATVKGDILTAALQGALGGVAFWVLGIQPAILWAVVMAFLSLLPIFGTALVWLPAAIYLIASGRIWEGIALTAWGVVVIGLADNLVRPILIGKDAKLPEYVVFFSTLGGITALGFVGFILGPIIAAMFMAAWSTFANGKGPRPQYSSL